MRKFTIRVPATTSNLGPGFDCLGLALDLWNESDFSFDGSGYSISIEGYQKQDMPPFQNNLIVSSFLFFCEKMSVPFPDAMQIHCRNRIPMGSGLGSSCTAVVEGLLAASAYTEIPLSIEQALQLSTEIEGHPDNAVAALYGGFCAVCHAENELIVTKYPIANWKTAVVVPHVELSTHNSRRALPSLVPLQSAVDNISHALLVVEALRTGDEEKLGKAMHDKIHQSYRIPLIKDANVVLWAAAEAGAAAVALSGAGPGLISFTMGDPDPILNRMIAVYSENKIGAEAFSLEISNLGASVTEFHS